MLRRLRGWRCLIRTRRMAELTPFLRAPVVDDADLAINQKSSDKTKFDHDFPGATTEWRVVSLAGHTAKASTGTRAPSCSDPYRSIRRGSSVGMDWRSYCCPAAAVRPSAHR